ncbi:MAG: hypothetical protein MMC33_002255 [Icmadophila ericetorum]|nr:hypothetical protein [Icmadophila ericetorum]
MLEPSQERKVAIPPFLTFVLAIDLFPTINLAFKVWRRSTREEKMSNLSARTTSRRENRRPAKDVATYYSSNTERKASFLAEAPSGSKHAARLQRICANVDPDVPQSALEQRRLQVDRVAPQLYLTQACAVSPPLEAQPEPAEYASSSVQYATPSVQYAAPSTEYTASESLVEYAAPSEYTASSTQYAAPLIQHISPRPRYANPDQRFQQQQRQQSTIPEVYRYERDGQVAYHKKSSRGETFISAPQGSVEARAMDEAARRRRAKSTIETTGKTQGGQSYK